MSADLSLNKSLYQCFSSINFNAGAATGDNRSEVRENVKRVHFSQNSN